jgi:hypothetical protein
VTTKKEMKAAEVLANQRSAFEKKVRALLGHVGGRVKKAELDAVFDALQYKGEYGPAADKLAAEIASREPVGKAIHAVKAQAVEFAEQDARKIVARVEKELAEAGWDAQAYAPYPARMHYGTEHDRAKAKHSLVSQLTTSDSDAGYQQYGREGHPYIVKMDPKGVERFVDNAMCDAAMQYDMFICKMVAKIGQCDSAELSGSHVWGSSILTVTKGSAVERWHTQQIVNYSKYGRPYLQWPSRLMKGGK